MAKSWATFCCPGTYKNNYQSCCGIKEKDGDVFKKHHHLFGKHQGLFAAWECAKTKPTYPIVSCRGRVCLPEDTKQTVFGRADLAPAN